MLLTDKIRTLREKRHLLQKELANVLSIDIPMYSRIERGERPFKKEYIKPIANFFNIDESSLLRLWFADKISSILIKNLDIAKDVLSIVENHIQMELETKAKLPIRVFEAFAGYGGASFGLIKAGIPHTIIGYSEIDEDAIELYNYNFPHIKNWGDITKINEGDIPDFDLFTGGFPCQPFSTVGKMLGELDIRGTLFGDIIRICEYKQPKYILLENVKGLKGAKHRPTFEKILSELKRIGYDVRYAILNSKDYGIPQTRERLWIFGYNGILPENFILEPPKTILKYRLKDYLDSNPAPELYRTEAQIQRLHEIHNVKKFDVNEPLCFDIYNKKLRTDGLCMTITPPEHNVIRIVEPIINGKERVRKLSLNEHFRLMGFTINDNYQEIKFPPTQNYTKLGRRAGNGWDINLVSILFKHIFNQL